MPVVTITGLKTTAGADLATNPSINTDAPFAISGANSVPQTCSSIKDLAILSSSSSSVETPPLTETYGLLTTSSNSISNKLTALRNNLSLADQSQELAGKTGYDTTVANGINIKDYITSISSTYLPIIVLVATCLQESLEVDTVALKAAQEKLDESKSRYESITNPERNVSYYEGWFPMVRPMTEPALFGLFAAAIFMLLLSILVFLRLSGVQIDVQIPEMAFSSFNLPPNASYYMYGGVAAGIIGGIGYAYYLRR